MKGVLQNSINLTTDASDILIVWYLRKIVPRLKVMLLVIPSMHTDCVTLPDGIGPYWAHWAVIMPSVPYTDTWGTAGRKKHVTLMIPHNLKIIMRLERCESWRVATSLCNIGSSAIYDIKKRKDHLWLFVASTESVNGLLKHQTLKGPQLVQLDKVLYKWFTAVHSIGKPSIGPMIIEKASVYGEMRITDKCTFSYGWLQIVWENSGIRRLGINPSAWGHLIPSSYCDVWRFCYRVFKLCRSLFKLM
jgi:hypothetical protein